MTTVAYIDQSKLATNHYLYVFGLNIFQANEVNVIASEDPRIVFLKTLHENCGSIALIGSLGLESIDDAAHVTEAYPPHPRSAIELYNGQFYQGAEDVKTAYIIPKSDQILESDALISLTRELLVYDSLAIFVPENGRSKYVTHLLLATKLTSQREWMDTCLRECVYIVQTQADGWYVKIFVKPETSTEPIAFAMDQAIRTIRQHPWYQRNVSMI